MRPLCSPAFMPLCSCSSYADLDVVLAAGAAAEVDAMSVSVAKSAMAAEADAVVKIGSMLMSLGLGWDADGFPCLFRLLRHNLCSSHLQIRSGMPILGHHCRHNPMQTCGY